MSAPDVAPRAQSAFRRINFKINCHYRDGTKIYVGFYEHHQQQGGGPCEYVEKADVR